MCEAKGYQIPLGAASDTSFSGKARPALDFDKPVRTKSGLAVRILEKNRQLKCENNTVVGLVRDEDDEDVVATWTLSGACSWVYTGWNLQVWESDFDLENVPEAKFDPTRPVQTRDGREAQILLARCTSFNYPLQVMVKTAESVWETWQYTQDGRFFASLVPSPDDLVNIPESECER